MAETCENNMSPSKDIYVNDSTFHGVKQRLYPWSTDPDMLATLERKL